MKKNRLRAKRNRSIGLILLILCMSVSIQAQDIDPFQSLAPVDPITPLPTQTELPGGDYLNNFYESPSLRAGGWGDPNGGSGGIGTDGYVPIKDDLWVFVIAIFFYFSLISFREIQTRKSKRKT